MKRDALSPTSHIAQLFLKVIINEDFVNSHIPSVFPSLLKETGWVAVIGLWSLNVHLASRLEIAIVFFLVREYMGALLIYFRLNYFGKYEIV